MSPVRILRDSRTRFLRVAASVAIILLITELLLSFPASLPLLFLQVERFRSWRGKRQDISTAETKMTRSNLKIVGTTASTNCKL